MFYVRLSKDNVVIVNAPFENKEAAIKYFNNRVDVHRMNCDYIEFDTIELFNENMCLFDYEV